MKKYNKCACFVTTFFIISFFLASCQKISTPFFNGEKVLLFSKPYGGISLYNFETKQIESLTNQKDYHPHLFSDKKTIYFVRTLTNKINQTTSIKSDPTKKILEQSLSKTEKRWAEINTIDPITKKVKKISTILLYDPGADPKDLVRFVDDFKKIIVFSQFLPTRIFDVATGKMLSENPSPFFPQCNIISDHQTFFVHVRQIPKKDFLVSLDQLEIPAYSDRLLEISLDGKIESIQESGKEQILKKNFYGYTYSAYKSKLIFSYNHELFIRENTKNNFLFPGVHPFCIGLQEREVDHLKFPWFQCSFILDDSQKTVIAEKNRIIVLDKENKKTFLITKDVLQIVNDNTDSTYLFDNIEWVGLTKNKKSILFISSKKQDEKIGPDRIVDFGKSPDLILLLRWDNGRFFKQFELSGKKDFTLEFKDLNSDGKNEIINQYSASDFLCEERFQAAGRSLVWIDVFEQNNLGIYVSSNQQFPQIYQELLTKLKPFHQRAITASRLKEPILCEEDIKKLETLIREAQIITRIHR